jgi:hypothetical protein
VVTDPTSLSFEEQVRALAGPGGAAPRAAAVDLSTIRLLPAPSAPALIELATYWRSKRIGPMPPGRDAIEPGEIVKHLPWLFMVDVLDDGADYRYRLLGTNIVAANYRDATGRRFSELYDDAAKLAGARLGFDAALRTSDAAFTGGRAFWRPDWAFDRFEAVFLPLSTDGRTVNIIVGEIAYLPAA